MSFKIVAIKENTVSIKRTKNGVVQAGTKEVYLSVSEYNKVVPEEYRINVKTDKELENEKYRDWETLKIGRAHV